MVRPVQTKISPAKEWGPAPSPAQEKGRVAVLARLEALDATRGVTVTFKGDDGLVVSIDARHGPRPASLEGVRSMLAGSAIDGHAVLSREATSNNEWAQGTLETPSGPVMVTVEEKNARPEFLSTPVGLAVGAVLMGVYETKEAVTHAVRHLFDKDGFDG